MSALFHPAPHRVLSNGDRRSASLQRWATVVVSAGLGLLSATAGFAQSQSDDPFAGVEEMVVTGSSTKALLTETSASAVAFDASALDSYGVEDVGDIADYVPNLSINTSNATNASFFVRGVGLQDFGANASSAVPIFQDGVVRNPSATQLVGLFDLGGVEVKKGPQGSGAFRNASAGAINISTRKPEPEFSAYASFGHAQIVSNDARDANKYSFETAIGSAVYEDWISARISARYEHENPWFENGCANRTPFEDRTVRRNAGAPALAAAQICGENVPRFQDILSDAPEPGNGISPVSEFLSRYLGEIDDWGLRGQLRIQPPDSGVDFTMRFEMSRLNRDSTLGQSFGTGSQLEDQDGYRDPDVGARFDELFDALRAIPPPNRPTPRVAREQAAAIVTKEFLKRPLDRGPFRGDFDQPGRLILETWSASTSGAIEVGDDSSIDIDLGYIDYRLSEVRDTDLSPNVRFPSQTNNQAWEVYGATALSGETFRVPFLEEFPLSWSTGFYTMIQQVEAFQSQQIAAQTRDTSFQEEIYSWGVFGEAEYEFIEGLTLSAGVRYNWERKDFEVSEVIGLPDQNGVPVPPLGPNFSRNQRTWDAFTGFAKISYAFTEDIDAYIKYSRGFKAGHFNASRPLEARNPQSGFADPESIDSIEWGVNAAAWEGRFTAKAAIFYYNYRNYQVFRLVQEAGVFRTIETARLARNFGADFEFTISPLEGIAPEMFEGLRITLNGGWLDTSYVEFSPLESRQSALGPRRAVTIDYSGNPLISAPSLEFTGTVTWPIVTNTFGTITPQYDFTWKDDLPFDPNRGRGELDPFGESRFSPFTIGNRAYALHNVRLTWTPPGESGFSVAGWCRNLEDRRFKNFAVDISNFAGSQLIFVGDPRRCGWDVRLDF